MLVTGAGIPIDKFIRQAFSSKCRVIFLIPVLAALCFWCPSSRAAQAATNAAAGQSTTQAQPAQTAAPIVRYTLPPEKLRQSVALARTGRRLYFAEFFWGLLVLLVILRTGLAAKFRDWALGASRWRIFQAVIFCPLLLLTLDIANLPFRVWGHAIVRSYNLSVQGWPSWILDWMKAEGITLVLATVAGWLLYELIQRSPRRWWMGAWVAALLLVIIGAYAEPLIIEPLFYDYKPLAASHPELVQQVERVVARAGITIPEDRILEMAASAKLNELNAYVTGIGSSKRVVFWDTILARTNESQSLAVFGHELGHYALNHVWKGIALSAIGLGVSLPFLAWLYAIVLHKWGSIWYAKVPQGWDSLAVLLLLIFVLQFASTPIDNALSRYFEHQADLYGLEVIHGIVPDAPQVTAQVNQILGETNLEEPEPSRLTVFWFYTHPPIADRITFALQYDPWSQGRQPEFIH